MITFGESPKESLMMKNVDAKCVDSQLWHACAGGMVQMPAVHSKVYYFAQGHAEHAVGPVEFGQLRIPALVLCRVSVVKFSADPETDEVFAKVRLIPIKPNDPSYFNEDEEDDDADGIGLTMGGSESREKPASFAKTLTQSDANNGGGFSVPRYCAETIFPKLDYSADPPVQTVLAKDLHGQVWKFRHIYRGTPRRHLLTTGWSTFVNQKKLVAGDSIVFMRAENGDLCVGIRRAKRVGLDGPSGWNAPGGNCMPTYETYSLFLREDERRLCKGNGNMSCSGITSGKGRVGPESVSEAARLAANGQPFEVVYYPRASTPEFCVKAAAVRTAMRVNWCPGMRFKMAFETEDSSRISWFMGTVSGVQVVDPIRWPNSPWRLLQVTWDEPDLLQNVRSVNPWLVELVSTIPSIHLAPFSSPRKKPRIPYPHPHPHPHHHHHHHPEFPLENRLPPPIFHGNPLGLGLGFTPPGIQGARHAQFGIPISDQTLLTPRISKGLIINSLPIDANKTRISFTKKSENGITPKLVLFGQPILTEEQLSMSNSMNSSSDGSGSGSAVNQNGALDNSSSDRWGSDPGPESGHCKVFMESEEIGRTVDLSIFASYEELYGQLADMFGVEKAELMSHVLYRDAAGALKHTGDEPFSEFMKTARRLTILPDVGGDNLAR